MELWCLRGDLNPTQPIMGPLGGVTHLDVRLGDGELVRKVPIDYFMA